MAFSVLVLRHSTNAMRQWPSVATAAGTGCEVGRMRGYSMGVSRSGLGPSGSAGVDLLQFGLDLSAPLHEIVVVLEA